MVAEMGHQAGINHHKSLKAEMQKADSKFQE